VPQDFDEVVKWYRLAAEQGEPFAQANLGTMYYKGQGVPQDNGEAAKWYLAAADQGHAQAQAKLGFMHYKGEGVARDHRESAKWYRKAAEQGNVFAQFVLGLMLDSGDGVPQDSHEAANWLRKAAEQGHAQAQTDLGAMYYKGAGVPQDSHEAAKWIRKAAEQGNAEAQFRLGAMYAMGTGVAQDQVAAYAWVTVSVTNGFVRAARLEENLYLRMTPDQIAAAAKLSEQIQATWEGSADIDLETYVEALDHHAHSHSFRPRAEWWSVICERLRYWYEISPHVSPEGSLDAASFDEGLSKECESETGHIQTLIIGKEGVLKGTFVLTMWAKTGKEHMQVLLDCDCPKEPLDDDRERNVRIIAYHLRTGIVFPEALKK
jgi:TPR repeat protein